MNPLLNMALVIADGRGDNPGAAGGILIIAGIVLGIAVLAFLGHLLIDRFGQTKRRSLDRAPQKPGRVGRVGKRRGP